MKRKGSLLRAIIALGAGALVTAAISGGAAAGGGGEHDGHGRSLVGTWDVAVTLLDPPPGVPSVGRALATFTADGNTIETSNSPPATRGPAQGVWKRAGARLYAVTRMFFRFNPQTGAYVGTATLNAEVTVAPDGETFTAQSTSELRDPAGDVVASGIRATASGRRMQVEVAPDPA